MRFGLNQYISQPVTLVGVLVVGFGVLAALVKFLSDLLGFIKNARDLRGSPQPVHGAAPIGERKAFVLGQRPSPAATVLTRAADIGFGWGLGTILAQNHGEHLPHDGGIGDAGHSLADADVHAVLQTDHHLLADIDADHHGFWDVIGDWFDSFSN
jgi:hypothetical protein